jgi:hypothetical protein
LNPELLTFKKAAAMKNRKSSCPVVHDACFDSLRLCKGCVKTDCRESDVAAKDVFRYGSGWPSFLENAALIEEESLSVD